VSTRNRSVALRDPNPQLAQSERVEVDSLIRNRFTGGKIWRTLAIDVDLEASDGRAVERPAVERAEQVEVTIGAGAGIA
jgi:hypothetical protein